MKNKMKLGQKWKQKGSSFISLWKLAKSLLYLVPLLYVSKLAGTSKTNTTTNDSSMIIHFVRGAAVVSV